MQPYANGWQPVSTAAPPPPPSETEDENQSAQTHAGYDSLSGFKFVLQRFSV